MITEEELYFINFRDRIGERVRLADYATPKARLPSPGYRRVAPLLYRILRPLLRRELKSTRAY